VLARSGDREGARRNLEAFLQQPGSHRPGAEIQVASIHAALGENDEAISWLERAYQERAPQLMFLNTDPSFVGLRSDPKFRDLLRRVHLL
jgi:hypothetical protein